MEELDFTAGRLTGAARLTSFTNVEKKIYNTSRSRTSRTIQSLKLKSGNIAKGWRRTRRRRRRMKGWGRVGERGGHVTRLE